MSKRIRFQGRPVIAVDETNNGFQEQGVPMIISSYFLPNYSRSHNNNEPFEKKKLAYRKKSPKQVAEFIRRSKEFFKRNPHFIYTTYSTKQMELHGLDGWAKAMASVVLKSLEIYQPKDIVIIPHRIDDKTRTEHVRKELTSLLRGVGINKDMQFRGDGNKNRAIRKADRASYYIAGLRLLQEPSKKWPHRRKRVKWDYVDQVLTDHLNEFGLAEIIEQNLTRRK